eukprot:2081306-Pleurochrysis_carterae.AAC.3
MACGPWQRREAERVESRQRHKFELWQPICLARKLCDSCNNQRCQNRTPIAVADDSTQKHT